MEEHTIRAKFVALRAGVSLDVTERRGNEDQSCEEDRGDRRPGSRSHKFLLDNLFLLGSLLRVDRIRDRTAQGRILRRHVAREERTDAAVLADDVLAEIPRR